MAIALLAMLAIGTPAHATSFAPLTIEQFTDASTYIVEGTVTEVWTELDPDTSMVWTRARVSISRTLKGPDAPTELIVDSAGGTWGDYSVLIPGRAVFSEGEDVFLFLDRLEGETTRLVPAAKFLGKYTIRRAPGEREQYARTWHTSKEEVYDARFLPHPVPEERLYLSDLRSRVEQRVAAGWDGQPIPGISIGRLEAVNTDTFRRTP